MHLVTVHSQPHASFPVITLTPKQE